MQPDLGMPNEQTACSWGAVVELVPVAGLGHFCVRFWVKITRIDELLKGYPA